MSFESLLTNKRKIKIDGVSPKPKKAGGCSLCPLNDVPGVNKIFGDIYGRDIMIWAQSPGMQENKAGVELIGPSGKFLWRELKRVGITRDVCDVQNVVRCVPVDYNPNVYPPLTMRNPTNEEISCCAYYTKKAMAVSKAKVNLIFGEIAHKQVLGNEYQKGKAIFWSEKMQAYVVCLYHPAYFIRQGYGDSDRKPNSALVKFRSDLNAVSDLLKSGGRFSYLKEQDYVGVVEIEDAKSANLEIKTVAAKGRRIAVDIEDGYVDGKRVILCVGFSFGSGRARVFCLDHPVGVEITVAAREFNWKVVRKLLADENIKKVFHHGSYDVVQIEKLMDVAVKGYDYDTEFGEYFYDPDAKAYGLQAIADRRYSNFAGYKEITAPEAFTEEFISSLSKNTKLSLGKKYELARKRNALNYASVPWDKMVLYNGADSDLTKRIEVSTKKVVNNNLMHIYMDAGFILAGMETRGPFFDYTQYEKLAGLYPSRVENWRTRLRKIAEDDEFNPGSPAQVKKLLFENLGLEMPGNDEPNTRAETLELLSGLHEAVELVLNYRGDAKILSTYLASFRRSADLHDGRLATKWWLCIAQGELVLTNRGYIPVETVRSGDLVLSHSGKARRVISTTINGVKPIVKVTLANGMSLKTTGNHPYRLVGNKWLCANQLHLGKRVIVYGDQEKWKTIDEFPRYTVSSWGRVRSKKKVLSLVVGDNGRLQVGFNGITKRVHRLVASAFLPNPSELVRHVNGYDWDNTLNNLAWSTTSENVNDKLLHGSTVKCHLTDQEIAEIRSAPIRHGGQTSLAKRFGVSRETIKDIRNNRYRTHVIVGKHQCVRFGSSEIVSIDHLPPEQTYGLTVDGDESHVTNGIVTHNTGTRTGRLSSGAGRDRGVAQGLVNLQNVINDADLKNMLVSDGNWREIYRWWKKNGDFTEESCKQFEDFDVFLGFDQSQFEIRVVAQRSGDKQLMEVFRRGEDIHVEVGNQLMGLPKEVLAKEGPERVAAKSMHFGIIYGLTAISLLAHIVAEYKRRKINKFPTLKIVQGWLDSYFEKFYKVKEMIDADHAHAAQFGYVETMFGMRRPINVQEQMDLGSTWQGSHWRNQAANSPIQGTAHQLLLIGLVSLIRQKEKYALLQRPVMEVHDAMYFFVKLKHLWKAIPLGTEMLEKDAVTVARNEFGIDWRVPLKVEAKAGFRFGVQVYKFGEDGGPKTTAEFLNKWCAANAVCEKKLKVELEKI